jgi:site-specific DNA recombinase
MRAAVYARYSTDLQSQASIEDQVRLCGARIETEGWSPVATYTDAALSGASRLRPGYQKLLADARAGAFDIVVAEALDRLSRDQEDTAALYKQLGFASVRLLTLPKGEISELHVGLKGTMNALFLKDLAMKTRRGLEGRVRQGRSGGGLSYGYRIAAERDAAGNPIPGGRDIDASEAEIVVRIFREYAAGLSPRAIARRLNADGIPGPGGRPWGDTTIRGHALRRTGLLHNDLYIGRLVWNRQRYVKDPQTGRRVARLNPESAWILHEVPDLRIVDDEL